MNIQLEHYTERDVVSATAAKLCDKIIQNEFKLYGETPEEGCYTPYDKFKNYVANLVADRIYDYMVNNKEIKKRIDDAIYNAERTIVSQYCKENKLKVYEVKEVK